MSVKLYDYSDPKYGCPECEGTLTTIFEEDSYECKVCNILWKLMWVPYSLGSVSDVEK